MAAFQAADAGSTPAARMGLLRVLEARQFWVDLDSEEFQIMKTLKFKDYLVPLITSGEKDSTWRFFDDKDLKEGDKLLLINKDTGKQFGNALIVSIREKKLGDLKESDFEGHEKFENEEKMYEAYRSYYGAKIAPSSIVKIIKFKLLQLT